MVSFWHGIGQYDIQYIHFFFRVKKATLTDTYTQYQYLYKMSYKVEHDSVLREIFQDWNKQAHNVHLVSKEGHRIFSHRTQESSFLL